MTIGQRAFFNCRLLITLRIPTIKAIGNSAFENCVSINEVVMPQISEIKMGKDIFKGCLDVSVHDSKENLVYLNLDPNRNYGYCERDDYKTKVTWKLTNNRDNTYTLTINRNGDMANYENIYSRRSPFAASLHQVPWVTI